MLQHCEMFPTVISMNLGPAGYYKPEKFEVAALFLQVAPTVHTNPSRKRRFLVNAPHIPEGFENSRFVF